MLMQAVFDLGREDVLTARHDHVVVAAFDVQASVVVQTTHVTGRREVAQSRLVLTAGVALECHRTTGKYAPGGTRCDVVAVVLYEAHIAAANSPTAEPGSIPQARR